MENRQYGSLLALRGIIAIAFGFLALLLPGMTVLLLAFIFGIFALVDGVGMIVTYFRRRVHGRYRATHLAAGVFALAAGIVALAWPAITVLALGVLIGAWAVFTGVLEIGAATTGRREWYVGLIGALSVIAGLLILTRPGLATLAVAQIIGVFAIIGGVLRLAETHHLYRRAHHDRMAPAGA